MSVLNLNPSNSTKAGSGSPIQGLELTKTGTPDPNFNASLLADPSGGTGLILTLSESGYIGITPTIEPGETGNPDRIKAQLTQTPGRFQQNFYFTLSLSDWTTAGGFILSIDVYSYNTPSTYQGTFKFTKKGIGEDPKPKK